MHKTHVVKKSNKTIVYSVDSKTLNRIPLKGEMVTIDGNTYKIDEVEWVFGPAGNCVHLIIGW